MFRSSLAMLVVVFTATTVVGRPPSADVMFQELSKDFGSVPRGPMLQHTFSVKNRTSYTARISSLRVSCGCVTATAEKSVLAPGEDTSIVAQMDTTRFTGVKSVTIYVQFDEPRREEVRLWVRANSREDVLVSPDTLSFGQIKRGTNPTTSVQVTFYGDSSAQILQLHCDSNYVQPKAVEVRRQANEVVYQLSAYLRSDAPVGKWYTDVWLTTNNAAVARVRVPLTVEIESALNISPSVVSFGEIKQGGEAERRVILRGIKPFKITGVRGTDSLLSVMDSSNLTKPVHVLTVRIRASQVGDLNRLLHVVTDLDGESQIEFRASATVLP